jgi:hypothetical protein
MKRAKTSVLIPLLFVFVTSVFAQESSYEIITHDGELFGNKLTYEGEYNGHVYEATHFINFGLDGKLWMGGSNEIHRLDGDTWTTFSFGEGFSDRVLYPKAVSPEGVVFFPSGNMGDSITRFDGETLESYSFADEGQIGVSNNIEIGPDGTVWAAGYGGFAFYFKDGTWTKTVLEVDIGHVSNFYIEDFAFDSDGIIYAAANTNSNQRSASVYKYAGGKWINIGPEGIEQYGAGALGVWPDGKIWFGTRNGNVFSFDGESWTKIVEGNEKTQDFEYEAKGKLKTIIEKEKEYYAQHGEYVNFDFGEDCDLIGWKAYYYEGYTPFICAFQDSIAAAVEIMEFNDDGDTDDGLTLSVTDIEDIIPGSDLTWETTFGEVPSGYRIGCIEFNSNGELWVAASNYNISKVFRYENETWSFFTGDDVPDDSPTDIIGVSPDGEVWLRSEKGVWQLVPTITNVETDESIPSAFIIIGNYPNPFNPSTTIEFTIPETGFINLGIYNIAGQKIRELVSDTMTAGSHSVLWDGRDESGTRVSSGMYMSRLVSGGNTASNRLLLIK